MLWGAFLSHLVVLQELVYLYFVLERMFLLISHLAGFKNKLLLLIFLIQSTEGSKF